MNLAFHRSHAVSDIRDRLDHPVIDGDGHLIELMPLVRDIVRDVADGAVAKRFERFDASMWLKETAEPSRSRGFLPVRVFDGLPARNTLDRMTATLPELLYRRLDEIGIDFALLYPSFGLPVLSYPDDEVRQATARALNTYYAEVFGAYRDRLEPVAVIPTFTPDEATAELDHAIGRLGLKTVVMSGVVPRAVRPDGTPTGWVDTLGHESLYDYDPVWAKCVELGVVPAFHGIGYGWGSRVSSSNYAHNHLGNFGAAQEAVCRSLLMGGVPKRFPDLRFAFLEGGVSWACQLLADALGHYSKRNKEAVTAYANREIDVELAVELFAAFARGRQAGVGERFQRNIRRLVEQPDRHPAGKDDFAESSITCPEDIIDIFRQQFYFGCEADDPMNALAFDSDLLPTGARLNAVFASDIGHWDVPDVRHVLPEAWELVEHGHLTADDFRDFTYGNIVRMLTAVNPGFFDGTAIGAAVDALSAAGTPPVAAR